MSDVYVNKVFQTSSFVGLVELAQIFYLLSNIIPFLRKRLIYLLDCWSKKLNFEDFVGRNPPDLIILDNEMTHGFLVQNLFDVIFASNIPKIVIPHAPHFIDPYYVFSPVNPYGKDFYPECEVWIPFKFSNIVKNHSDIMHKVHYIGYPGFDEEWLNYCKTKVMPKNKNSLSLHWQEILDQHIKKPENLDNATMDFDTVLADLLLIRKSFLELQEKIT